MSDEISKLELGEIAELAKRNVHQAIAIADGIMRDTQYFSVQDKATEKRIVILSLTRMVLDQHSSLMLIKKLSEIHEILTNIQHRMKT